MSREILKGLTMLTLIVALAFVTAVATANGQTNVTAQIPFQFIVGDKMLASGEYTVSKLNQAALLIQSNDFRDTAVRLADRTEPEKNKAHARLVFHRYGDRYFLAQVWTGAGDGRELAKSELERAIERETRMIAAKRGLTERGYEVVEIAALAR